MTTTAPIIGSAQWDGVPRPDDRHLLSASSIADAMASDGLERWKRRRSATWALDNVSTLAGLATSLGRDAAIDTVANAYRGDPDGVVPAWRRGELCHDRLEAHLKNASLPTLEDWEWAQVWPYLLQVDAAVVALELELVAAERVVFLPADGVAGRFDLKARSRRLAELGVILLDLKSGDDDPRTGRPKRVYADSHGIQLAAYRFATHEAHGFEPRVGKGRGGSRVYYVNDAELALCIPPTPPDTCAILQVTPTAWRLVRMRIDDTVHAYLRSVVNTWRWLHLVSPDVAGETLLESEPT